VEKVDSIVISNPNSDKNPNPNFFYVIMTKFGFIHVEPDNDGLYKGLVMPKPQADYLFYTSFGSLVGSLYGFYKKQYINSLGVFLIFVTSLNYWRNPVYGWRRNIDIITSILGLSINIITSHSHPRCIKLNLMLFISLLFYPLGFYFQHKSIHLSAFSHSLIHIIGNLVCISYYSDPLYPLLEKVMQSEEQNNEVFEDSL
jgi:hypothetical protein